MKRTVRDRVSLLFVVPALLIASATHATASESAPAAAVSSHATDLADDSARTLLANKRDLATSQPDALAFAHKPFPGAALASQREVAFARIPVPDRFDEGGFFGTMSADGTRVALTRSDSSGRSSVAVWLYDSISRDLVRIADDAQFPSLSGNGRMLAYDGNNENIVLDLETGSEVMMPFGVTLPGVFDFTGERYAYRRIFGIDGEFAGYGAYLYDVADNEFERISQGPIPHEVDEVEMSADGRFVAFTSETQFDPSASTGGRAQIFVYDVADRELRQATGRPDGAGTAFNPALNADGRVLTYRTKFTEIRAMDLSTGEDVSVVDVTGIGGLSDAFISADGTRIGFLSSADLVPDIGNSDLSPEVYVADLETGTLEQVTDSSGLNGLFAMDSAGEIFLLDGGGDLVVDGLVLFLRDTRVVPRRIPNASPALHTPEFLQAREGKTMMATFSASDAEMDPLTFYVQFQKPSPSLLLRDFGSDLQQIDASTAEFRLTPRFDQAGEYVLHVAVFDEAGGVSARAVPLLIADTNQEADANCDGRLDESDLEALFSLLFADAPDRICQYGDTNGDGSITAADLSMWSLTFVE